MKRIMFVLFVTVMGSMACKDKKQVTSKDAEEQKTVEVVREPAEDSAAIRTVITDFYNWYNKNYAKFQEYYLYSGIKKKDAPPYKINWDAVQKYQQFIRDSVPQLGEGFLANQKSFFHQCDSAFKVDVEDDIPYGFDYDWYTNSQEDPQYLIDELNKAHNWKTTLRHHEADVAIMTWRDDNGKKTEETIIEFLMKLEMGTWTIARIGRPY